METGGYSLTKVKLQFKIVPALLFAMVFGLGKAQAQSGGNLLSAAQFSQPANQYKPLTWWHWINGNVTKAGIKKDLLDIKRVGIGGVQLFDTHMYLPKGPVRYGTDVWFEHVRYAMQLCDSLGLEFYIANSPGWSGAGGPWVSLDQSMKQLVYSETDMNNGGAPITLTTPYTKNGYYKDVAVIAVAARGDGEKEIKDHLIKISGLDNAAIKNITDGDYATAMPYTANQANAMGVLYEFNAPININVLNITLCNIKKQADFEGEITVSADGKEYRPVAKYSYPAHKAAMANFSIPFKADAVKYLRLIINNKNQGSPFSISEIKLRKLNSLNNWQARTGMVKTPFLAKDSLNFEGKPGLAVNEIIVITPYFNPATGQVKWTAPKGRWTILRFGYTTTGQVIHPAVDEGAGYEVDKLDPEAVTYQFNHALGRVISDACPLQGKTFKGILFDSYEGGYQNWTAGLPQMFKAKTGYDLLPYLPVMTGRVVANAAKTSAVMWDFQQALTALFAQNYYGTMQKLAHNYNLKVFSESQGGPMSPAYANAYTDVPMNEFWTDGIDKREKLIKQTVSIADVLGRNVVAAEAFTSKPEFGKWQNLPENLKSIGDYAFSTGINRFIFHTYTHQPYDFSPGFTMGRYGTHFGRTNTWWPYANGWINYIGRSQYLLQQGHMVADVCLLFPDDAVYEFPPQTPVVPKGYNYDICYPAYLDRIKVTNGSMQLPSGASYKLLVLPEYRLMSYETLLSLQSLLKNGAVISGPPPVAAPGMAGYQLAKDKFNALVKTLWGNLDGKTTTVTTYGKGKIYWGRPISKILTELNLKPDFTVMAKYADSIRYVHKTMGQTDIYYISNQANAGQSVNISLREKGKQPEIWDAITGKTYDAMVFDTANNRTNIPFKIDANGSVFIVFNKALNTKWISTISLNKGDKTNKLLPEDVEVLGGKLFSDSNTPMAIIGPWQLSFLNSEGATENISLNNLELWQNNANPAIKYYSGTVSYSNHFILHMLPNPAATVMLDLGSLYDIAEVFVNNKPAGVIWKKPYRIDVSGLLKKGNNSLKIMVTNRWVNRLIGDESIKTDLKYEEGDSKFTKGRLLRFPAWLNNPAIKREDTRNTFTTWKQFNPTDSLVNSGLIGPVKLVFYKYVNLR